MSAVFADVWQSWRERLAAPSAGKPAKVAGRGGAGGRAGRQSKAGTPAVEHAGEAAHRISPLPAATSRTAATKTSARCA